MEERVLIIGKHDDITLLLRSLSKARTSRLPRDFQALENLDNIDTKTDI